MCYRPTLYFLKDSKKKNQTRAGESFPLQKGQTLHVYSRVCAARVCMFWAFQAMSMASKAHNYNINFSLLDTALAQRGGLVPFSGCCEKGEVAGCFHQRKQHTLAWRNSEVTHKYTKCKNIFAVLPLPHCLSLSFSLSLTHTHTYTNTHTGTHKYTQTQSCFNFT